jgi:hypothetical protein
MKIFDVQQYWIPAHFTGFSFHGGDYEKCHERFEVFTAVNMKNGM